jgi:hypothetical protein
LVTIHAIILAGGTWVFLGFVLVLFFAVAHGYYSRTGSAINQHPYHDAHGDAPGAAVPSTLGRDVERRDYSRGTR